MSQKCYKIDFYQSFGYNCTNFNKRTTMLLSKFKLLILSLLLGESLLASHASFFSLYIPVANPQANLMEKNGIALRKILLTSYNIDADITGVTWEHKVNSHDDFL